MKTTVVSSSVIAQCNATLLTLFRIGEDVYVADMEMIPSKACIEVGVRAPIAFSGYLHINNAPEGLYINLLNADEDGRPTRQNWGDQEYYKTIRILTNKYLIEVRD